LIDLHTHTTASDGSHSPAELMHLARDARLEAIAVTDHDTLAGLDEAQSAAQALDLELVPGVELACHCQVGTLHMLGYFLDPHNQTFNNLLSDMIASRAQRNPQIIAKLNDLGYELTMDDVCAQAGGPIISRLHIAQAMLEKGYVRSTDEAFGRFLGDTGSAYAQRTEPDPAEAIDAIHSAGGLAVVAHPVHLRAKSELELTTRLKLLADVGLDGIEVWYPEHNAVLTDQLWRFCRKAGLAAIGGSDFHGSVRPHISLGIGRGGMNIPIEILHRLKERLNRR